MNRTKFPFPRLLVILFGLAAATFLWVEPHLEGRNVNATWFQIYFNDPFLAYVYVASIPFFTVVFQTFKALGDPSSVAKRLRVIKYSAGLMTLFAMIGLVIILRNESDDRAGGVVIGSVITLASISIAFTSAVFERRLNP